jgi:hypothetical protein
LVPRFPGFALFPRFTRFPGFALLLRVPLVLLAGLALVLAVARLRLLLGRSGRSVGLGLLS